MSDIFKNLEGNYGQVFLSHSIFYITAFKNGISEQELQDIFNLDHAIYDEVFGTDSDFEDKEFLSNYGQLLRNDLASYLKETEVNGTQLIAWRNSSYYLLAREYYMQKFQELRKNKEVSAYKDDLLMIVIDYFSCGLNNVHEEIEQPRRPKKRKIENKINT
jgi:hypothetical protein